jgi:serine/threonine-protein kinase
MLCARCGVTIEARAERCPNCAAAVLGDDPLIGQTLGEYRLVRRLARGGQSSVYEAQAGSRRAAVKVLHPTREGAREPIERLRREAIAIRRLTHPNVVRLLEQGDTADGTFWLAMEFLEGESLAELLERRGTLPEAEIIAILAPVCDALEQAHRKGILHRDLKPQNIMLVKEAGVVVPKLLDFGIAALLDADSLTSSVTVSGTPMYMAPEQWDGLKHAGPASDIYALGAIVYQALSGKYAYEADTPLVWMKKVHSETPLDLSVAMAGATVSPSLCAAVMKALARRPEDRPQTPLEFLRALRPPPPSGFGAAQSTRRQWLLGVAGGCLLGVAAGVGLTRLVSVLPARRRGAPLVVLMDTPVPHGVYDAEVAARGGTNADTLSDALRDLPIDIQKETIPATWDRERHIVELTPDAIVIHRSAFFHGLNAEFGFGYEPFPDEATKSRWALLYRTADDKLTAFLGFLGTSCPRTKFLVYSRGTGAVMGSGWPDPEYRRRWILDVERRFPALQGRLVSVVIEGGVTNGSFKNGAVIKTLRETLRSLLELR